MRKHTISSAVEPAPAHPLGLPGTDAELVDNISALVDAGQQDRATNILAALHPADLAQLLIHLPLSESKQVLTWLPIDCAGEVLAELDDDFRAHLLEGVPPNRITALLDKLDTDDAVDLLADLPGDVARKVLPSLEDAKDVEKLLGYDEKTAGGIMGTEYVAVPRAWTIAKATEEVRRNAEAVVEVFSVFVVDMQQQLEGAVTLKRLLLSPADALIGDIMEPDVISVTTDMDQEAVAHIMERYDLVSLPVVDADRRLVGCITIDDVVDVIREEAEEDIQRMSGVSGGAEPTDSVLRIIAGRLPWLLAGLLGAGLSALVIGSFEEALEQAVILAGFIPIVMATAGNAGIQSSAIAVQGLASGDVWASDMAQRLGKELIVAVVNGLVAAIVLGLLVIIASLFVAINDPIGLAFTAGLSLTAVIILAATIGATVPLILHRFGVDPAIATGPFITTSNDVLGVLIFFLMATLIYLS